MKFLIPTLFVVIGLDFGHGTQIRNRACVKFETDTQADTWYTGQGYYHFKRMEKLHMKMWDPNNFEEAGARCIRLKFDDSAATYRLSYIDPNDDLKILTGTGEYKFSDFNPRAPLSIGVSIDLDDGLQSIRGILMSERGDSTRLHLKGITSSSLVVYGCKAHYYAFGIVNRWDATYMFSTSNTTTTEEEDQQCVDDSFAADYNVRKGKMKLIDMDMCNELYDNVGGDQL